MVNGNGIFIAGTVALVASAIALMIFVRFAERLQLLDHPGGRKRHSGAVPLVGGLSVAVGVLAGATFLHNLQLFEYWVLATGALLIVVGALDDAHPLGVRIRVLVQAILIIGMMLATGVSVHHLGNVYGHSLDLGWLSGPFTVVALIGLVNAFNLIDGIDGLANTMALVAICGVLATTGAAEWHAFGGLLAVVAIAMIPQFAGNLGALGRRGRCFLGDAGSTLLGYLVGWALIRFSQMPETHLSPVGALWCVAIPVLDTLSVMARRLRAGKSPFKPDRRHIHYLLVEAGFSRRMALVILAVAAIVMWCFGALVRMIHLGTGTNLIAFSVVMVAYAFATHRMECRLATQASRHDVKATATVN